MPRIARSYQKALCYHVMNRGVNGQAVFADDRDREYFVGLIREYKQRCAARVYHWVLMGNHYHLLIEVAHERLRNFAGGIQQAYAQYHHRRHEGSGVFWQGRYKSKAVEVGAYVAICGRYIERNPARAGLTTVVWEWQWSSARAYVMGVEDGVTDQNPYLGEMTTEDRVGYGEALTFGVDEKAVQDMGRKRAWGSDEFVSRLIVDHGRHRSKRGRRW